jgi:hypothetical protein
MTQLLVATKDGVLAVASGAEASAELAGRTVQALARDGESWWAAVDQELWRREPEAGWSPVVTVELGRPTCLHPTRSGLLVGTEGAHLATLAGDGLKPIGSFERLEQRQRWSTPWGGPPATRSLAVAADGTTYANVHVGGIARSIDGWSSWEPTIDIDADPHQVVAGPAPEDVYTATGHAGLGVSEDRGRSWRFHDAGLHGTYLRAVAIARETVYITASTGARGGAKTAVYRRGLGSEGAFERCEQGLPEWFEGNIDTGCLDASGDTVALGTGDGRVYLSEDAGRSWTLAADGLASIRQLVIMGEGVDAAIEAGERAQSQSGGPVR